MPRWGIVVLRCNTPVFVVESPCVGMMGAGSLKPPTRMCATALSYEEPSFRTNTQLSPTFCMRPPVPVAV